MCNSVLRVKRRLLALLLIVGCMAISVPAFARVCFLPDSKDCGIPGIKDIPETCDGINTFTDVDGRMYVRHIIDVLSFVIY